MRSVSCIALFLFFSLIAEAVELPDTGDTFDVKALPTRVFGAATSINVRPGQNGYLQFDLSVLPPGATGSQVLKATLRLWVSRVMTSGTIEFAIPTADWSESTLDALNAPPFSLSEVPSLDIPLSATRTYIEVDVTGLVQDWVDGTLENFGIAILPGLKTPNIYFDSKENDHQPVIDVSLASPGSSGTSSYSTYAATSGTATYATTSGTATFATTAATSGSAAVSGSAQFATVAAAAESGTVTAIGAILGCAKIDIGDSITESPNGAGQTSWAALLNTMSFFAGRVTDYNTAIGGSVIGNGPTIAQGAPQTATASWSGPTTSINLTSGSAYSIQGPMAVTGTNIPYGTTGTLSSSGTLLTLSKATTGASGGSATINLGGDNMMDRFASQVYPHRPTAFGGDGGPVSYALIMGGANDLDAGRSATTIISELVALTATCEAVGITPYVSTILPEIGQDFWTYAQEAQRQIVNNAIREYGIPGAIPVDSCNALSGDPTLFDSNGVHPIGRANQMLASYWNSALSDQTDIFQNTPQYVDTAETFDDPITINQGIQYTGSSGQNWFAISQPGMAAGATSTIYFGGAQNNNDSGVLSFGMDGLVADPTNNVGLGVYNSPNSFEVYGTGEVSVGISPAAWKTVGYNTAATLSVARNAEFAFEGINDGTTAEVLEALLMPNITPGQFIYGPFLGTAVNNKNSGGLFFQYTGGSQNSNAMGLVFASQSPGFWYFASGDFTLGTSGTDNGYGLEVNGTERVDANDTVGGAQTITTTGTSAATGPANTTTPALWEKVLVNGTTAWRALYQ